MKLAKNKIGFIKFLIFQLILGILVGISRVSAQGSGKGSQSSGLNYSYPGNFMPPLYYSGLPYSFYLTHLTALGNMMRNMPLNTSDIYFPFVIASNKEWITQFYEIYESSLVSEMLLSPPNYGTTPAFLSSSISYGNAYYNNMIYKKTSWTFKTDTGSMYLSELSGNGEYSFPGYKYLTLQAYFAAIKQSPPIDTNDTVFYGICPTFSINPIDPVNIIPYFYGIGGSIIIPPLPCGITLHIDVVGYVFDADLTYLPLEGVTVATKNTLTEYSVTTGFNGRFVIELFPNRYTLVFSKAGYQDKEIDVKVIAGMESIIVYMKKQTDNKEPALDVSYVEVIAGDEIILDPDALVSDPDEDPITFSYSGWESEYWQAGLPYTTSEADIGSHDVYITFSDGKSPDITDILVIDIYPGYEMVLYEGLNLISYPFENGDPNFSAFDFMERFGGYPLIDSIAYYDNLNDRYITAWYDSNGDPTGDEDFPIRIGQGYIVYANEDIIKKIINRYDGEEHDLELYRGINLAGIASLPDGYTSYELLWELKGYSVDSIYRYDPFWGDWETTYWLNGSPAGNPFTILMGEGYYIRM